MSTVEVDLRPARVDILAYEGDSINLPVTITNPDESPFDFSGATPAAQVRETRDSSTTLLTFEIEIDEDTPGRIILKMDADQVVDMPKKAWWDLQITDSLGRVKTYLYGKIKFGQEVTR